MQSTIADSIYKYIFFPLLLLFIGLRGYLPIGLHVNCMQFSFCMLKNENAFKTQTKIKSVKGL